MKFLSVHKEDRLLKRQNQKGYFVVRFLIHRDPSQILLI